MAVLFDATGSNPSVPSAGSDRAVIQDWVEVDLDLDATGQILLYQFPEVAFLRNVAGEVNTFFAEAAGGSFVGNLHISGSDGVNDYTDILLPSVTATANAADASDQMTGEAGLGAFIDVGGKYITLNITTVGTNTACTVQLGVKYSQNVIKKAIVAS